MPEANPEEIAGKIRSGEIKAISLDTSIFDGRQLALEAGLLRHLSQFRGSDVKFILSEIVSRELLAHLIEHTSKAIDDLNRFFHSYELHWQISSEVKDAAKKSFLQDGAKPETVANRRLDEFFKNTGADILNIEDHLKVNDLMNRYFRNEPPFGKLSKKKNEFPDAIALLSLAAWAKNAGTKILVASEDSDWLAFCASSEDLYAIKDLGSVLALFNNEASVAAASLSQKIKAGYPELDAAILDAMSNQIDKIDFTADASSDYFYEDEFHDAVVRDTRFIEFDHDQYLEVIEQEHERLAVRAFIIAEMDVTFGFTFSVRDGVDKDYIH